MASIGKKIGDSLKKILFREVEVTGYQELSASFKRLELAGDALKTAPWAPGDKVQLALDAGARTYSPFAWDRAAGRMSVLVYLHGDTSSVAWAKGVAEGERLYSFGPRRSLPLASLIGPVVLFGDETSFGVARALLESRPRASELGFVFETSDASASRTALASLQVSDDDLVERTANDAHLPAIEERLRAALEPNPRCHLVFTGKAQSIQALRRAFKVRPVAHASQTVKAYWAPGKRGLD